MAIKKEMKAWAIKLRGRSFYQSISTGMPYLYRVKNEARFAANTVTILDNCKAEPVRVKIKVEEV